MSTTETDVVVTVDTEADNQWLRGNPISTENLDYIPRFQKLCHRFGLKPVYLCTYEVVKAPVFETLKAYQDNGTAEIGAHLHPWSNPPFIDFPEDTSVHTFPSELSDSEFRDKVTVLTDLIEKQSGQRPVTFRAGRWGFKASHVEILSELGYTVDCSVTPYTTWRSHKGAKNGGQDFRRAPQRPYYLDHRDVCSPGASDLLEVPMTIVLNKPLSWKLVSTVFGNETSFAFRASRRLLGLERNWFRPFPHMAAEQLMAVYREAVEQELPVVDFMLHSSELMPGCSPYNPTTDSIEDLYERLEKLFEFMKVNGARGVTLREFAETRR